MATLRKAKRYVAPSMKVVAGPKAAICWADVSADPDNPTKDVSTKDNKGPAIHNPKHGKANFKYSWTVGNGGSFSGMVAVTTEPPPRTDARDSEASVAFSFSCASVGSSSL